MKSPREQREKLLQMKLEEMADIGVRKRTEGNIPGSDNLIDLDDDSDSVKEDAGVFLFKIGEQEEIPKETAFNGTNAKMAQLSKRKRNGRTKDSSSAVDFPEYER